MKTPFAPVSRLGTRSSLLLALAAAALVGCGGSGTPDTRITKAPAVTSQPRNVGVNVGGSATFSVKASGKGLTYQWFRNSTAISGATGSSFTINPVTPADYGNYSVRIGNDAGEIVSGFATLAPPVTGAPTITTQPSSVATTSGSAAGFSVEATGDGELTYQWYRNGAAISGATGATYPIPSVGSGNTGSYYVIVTNSKGSTQSTSVNLTIAVPAAPTIQTQPISNAVSPGNLVSFTVVAKGSPTPRYQWFKNGVEIPGATRSTYTIPSASNDSEGEYYVVVTNSLGSATSNVATLVIGVKPNIVNQPEDATGNQGTSVTLTVGVAPESTPPFTYQWYRATSPTLVAFEPIPGATASEYTINSLSTSANNGYQVKVTNRFGSETSRTARITVIGPPAISTEPSDQLVALGGSASFSVTATGVGSLRYQWYKDGGAIPGATSSTYTITNTVANDDAQYYVRVTNDAGFTQSRTARLVVRAAPNITSQPQSQTVSVGANVTFSVTATSPGVLTFQWYKGGAAISGATSSIYTINSAVVGDAGTYKCRVTADQVIFRDSNDAILTVNP